MLPLRQQLQRDVMSALEQLVNLAEHQREYQAGIRYAQRLLGLDPLHEASYRRLMQLHALNGDRAAALHHYHTCATLLQQELGVAPDEETHALYQRLLNLEHQPAQPPTLLTAAPLVGRSAEWQTLLTAWRTAQRGQAHFVSLAGEAGMGKTRLAEELLTWANAQGIRVARTRSYEAEGGLAYAPITEWLRTDALKPARKKLEKVWLSEVARLLPELLSEDPTLSPPAPLTESWQRQRFFEALARSFLAEKTHRLLFIDDLQWCDAETMTWLRFLLRFDPRAPLLILGAWRSEAVTEQHPLRLLLRDLQNANQLTTIELLPLTPDETRTLARHLAGDAITTATIQQLYQVTEGHPLFVVEIVRANRQSPMTNQQALPAKVQSVIQARLTQLSGPALELAELAATIGRRFTVAVLAQASQHAEETLVRALDELWQRRIVHEQDADTYDFSHDRLREVAYQGLSQVRRRFFHRRVAEALEAINGSKVHEISAQLAAHYEQAGITAKSARYWQCAGEHAMSKFAQQDAIRYLSRALDLTPDHDQEQRCDLLLLRARLFEHQGMIAEEQDDLNALQIIVIMLDNTAVNRRRRSEAALCTATFLTARNEHEQARIAAQMAVDLSERCGATDLTARGQFMLGMADCGDYATYPAARLRFEKALALARTNGLYEIEAKALDMLGAAGIYMGGRINEITNYFQQTLAIYQKHGDLIGEVATLGRFAFLASIQRDGQYEQAIRNCYQALQLGSDIAGWESEGAIVGCLGYLRYLQGDYGSAQTYMERSVLVIRQGRRPHSLACAFLDLGAMALDQGNYIKGKAYLEDALSIYRSENRQEQHITKVLGLLALYYHYQGEQAEAMFCSEEAVRLARTLNDPRIEGEALTRSGRMLTCQGKFDEAIVLFHYALVDFHQTEQYNRATMPLAGLAEIALRQGNLPQTQTHVDELLAYLTTHQLDRTDEELYVYMTGYRVLHQLGDQRANQLLQLAHEQLQIRSASLSTEAERRLFWAALPHAEVFMAIRKAT